MTELILVRHGETEWNQQRLLQGHLDSPLTVAGVEQAHLIGPRIAALAPDHIYSSDTGRAYHTAQIIATYHQRPIVTDAAFRERCLGLFQGYTWDTLATMYPDAYQQYRSGNRDYMIPEGESYQQFLHRVVTGIQQLADHHPQEKTLLVTHGGVIGALVRHVLGIPLSMPRRFTLKNTSINRIVVKDGDWFLDTLGDTSHLETQGDTGNADDE